MTDQNLPVLTGETLDQWEQSARADLAVGSQWSAHPLAVLAAVAEIRHHRNQRTLGHPTADHLEKLRHCCPDCGAEVKAVMYHNDGPDPHVDYLCTGCAWYGRNATFDVPGGGRG